MCFPAVINAADVLHARSKGCSTSVTVLCIPDSRAQEEGASAILCGGFDDGVRNNHRDPGWFDTAGKQASFGCLTGMRGPLKHAVTKELLAPTSARGSVCLVQRVCPSNGLSLKRGKFLPFKVGGQKGKPWPPTSKPRPGLAGAGLARSPHLRARAAAEPC